MGSSTHSDNESVYSNDPSIASNTRGDDASSTGAQSLLSSLAELPSKAKRRQMKQSRTNRERSNSRQRDADGSVVRSRSRHNSRKDPEYNDDESTVASNTIASESVFTANIVEEGRSSSRSRGNSKSHRSSRHKKKKELCTTNCSPFNICSGVHLKTLIFCILGTTAIMKLTSNPPVINTSHGISGDNNGLGSTVYSDESMNRDLKSNLRGSSSVSDVLDIDGVVKPTYNDGSDEEDEEDNDSGDNEEEENENASDDEDVKEAFDPPEDITESQQDQFDQQQQLGSLGTPIEQKPNSLMSSPAANSLLQSDVPPPASTEAVIETVLEEGVDSTTPLQQEGTVGDINDAPATTLEGGGFTSQLQLPQLATTTQQQQTGLVGSDPSLAVQPQLAVGQQALAADSDGTVQSPLLQTQQVQGGAGFSGLGQTQTSLLQPQQVVIPGSAPVQQQQDASSQLQQLQISPTGGLTPSTGDGVDVNAAQQRLDEHASDGFDIESAQAKLKKLQDLQAQLAARQAAQQQQQQMVPASGVAGVASPLAPREGDAAVPQAQSATSIQEQQVAPPVDAAGSSSLGAFDPTLFQPPVAVQQQQQQVPEAPSGGSGGEFAQQGVPAIQEQAVVTGGGGLEQPAVSSKVAAPKVEFDPFRPV